MAEDKKTPKRKIPFQEAMALLIEKYGYCDFAFAIRAVDGSRIIGWEAGDGDSLLGDYERIDALVAGLERVKAKMLIYQPQVKPQKGAK